jgi:SAM-dependent methyltransferase
MGMDLLRRSDRSASVAADEEVVALFGSAPAYWRDVYAQTSLQAHIFRQRHARALSLVSELSLPYRATILEIGCGAALLSAALGERRYLVKAIDSSNEMVQLARDCVRSAGVESNVTVTRGDAHSLAFPNGVFNLVVALGVIPWLHSPMRSIREIKRVLRRGGYVILTSDNRGALNRLLDPATNPAVAPLKEGLKFVLQRAGLLNPPIRPHTYYTSHVDWMVGQTGLRKVIGETFGFGTFTFLGRKVLHDATGLKVDAWLQSFADRDMRIVRSLGQQYIVVAEKPSR